MTKTYIIEEVATYYVYARSAKDAERRFLNGIAMLDKTVHSEVHEREVYADPEDRLKKVKV